jgi:hypothetical protein
MGLLKEEIKFYAKDECAKPFIKLNKVGNTNEAGKYVSGPSKIGPMVETLNKNSKRIKTAEDFYNIWINEILTEKIKGDPRYNDVFDYILSFIKKFKEDCNADISDIDLYKYFLFLAIHATMMGVEVENVLEAKINKSGKFIVKHSNAYEDSNLGIDLIFFSPDDFKPLFLLQIKPISFVRNNQNDGVKSTRRDYFNEILRAEKEYGVPVYFAFYKEIEKTYNPNNVVWVENTQTGKNYPSPNFFKLSELCFRKSGKIGPIFEKEPQYIWQFPTTEELILI